MEAKAPEAPTVDQVAAPTEPKPKKEKKPATEAQLAARAKGLAAMTAKRKAISKEVAEKKETLKIAKKAVEDKIIKEDLGFAFRSDVDSLRKELAELKALHTVKEQAAKQEKPKERVVERIIERVPTAQAPVQKLTGHALLDSIFFNK